MKSWTSILYKNFIDTCILFQDLWKKSNILPVHKEKNNCYKITDQFLCFLFLRKFLGKFCSIQYLNIYKKITYFSEGGPTFKDWRKNAVEWFIYKEYVLNKYFVFKFKNMVGFESQTWVRFSRLEIHNSQGFLL